MSDSKDNILIKKKKELLKTINKTLYGCEINIGLMDLRSVYNNNTPKLGRALVINNTTLLSSKRLGAEKDTEKVLNVLCRMGFDIDHRKDLSASEMLDAAESFSNGSFKDYAISMVIIMGSGLVQSDDTHILDHHHNGVPTYEIVDKFQKNKCDGSLNGKPKMFIFQCSRARHGSGITIPEAEHISDTLIAYSTAPGQESFRDPVNGSIYMQTLCDIFEECYKTFHIEYMLDLVKDRLKDHFSTMPNKQQTPNYSRFGFEKCYLHLNPENAI